MTGAAPGWDELLVSHWQVDWPLDVAVIAYAALYLWGVARVRGRWPLARSASFLAGLACLPVALQSGLGAYDERLLSVHMVQHMVLLLLAPLLLWGGRPVILALRALPAPRRAGVVRALDRLRGILTPPVCVGLFSAVLLLTHLTPLFAATLRHPVLHAAEHVLFVAVGMVFWWPLLDADPVPAHRLGGFGRLVYLLAAMPAMGLVGAYLNRATSVVYAPYAAPARALGLSAVADQQQAGAIMWVGGSSFMVAVGLWVAMAALVAEERRLQAREAREAPR